MGDTSVVRNAMPVRRKSLSDLRKISGRRRSRRLRRHALLPARRLMPEKVRCFLDALEEHAQSVGPPDPAPIAEARTG